MNWLTLLSLLFKVIDKILIHMERNRIFKEGEESVLNRQRDDLRKRMDKVVKARKDVADLNPNELHDDDGYRED